MNISAEHLLLILYWSTIGLVIGSFLGVVIDRIPLGESIVKGRSKCDYCKNILLWYELIPIFSFLFQKGKCKSCKKKLSWRYPVYELLTSIIFGVLAFKIGLSLPILILASLIACGFIAILFIDLDHMIIPDNLLWFTGIVSFVWLLVTSDYLSWSQVFINHGLSAGVAFLLFYGIWRVTKKKGMGYGDVLLVIVIGLLLGFPTIIFSLYLAFLTGACVAIILLLLGRKGMKSAISFGPFLILGMVLTMFIDISFILKYIL